MNGYEVTEFYYDEPDTVRVVASFTDEVEAQEFAQRHYMTQIADTGECDCPDCTEGWCVLRDDWKTYCVEVWEANACPVCHEPPAPNNEGCTCWLCDCMTTNHRTATACRSCHREGN